MHAISFLSCVGILTQDQMATPSYVLPMTTLSIKRWHCNSPRVYLFAAQDPVRNKNFSCALIQATTGFSSEAVLQETRRSSIHDVDSVVQRGCKANNDTDAQHKSCIAAVDANLMPPCQLQHILQHLYVTARICTSGKLTTRQQIGHLQLVVDHTEARLTTKLLEASFALCHKRHLLPCNPSPPPPLLPHPLEYIRPIYNKTNVPAVAAQLLVASQCTLLSPPHPRTRVCKHSQTANKLSELAGDCCLISALL